MKLLKVFSTATPILLAVSASAFVPQQRVSLLSLKQKHWYNGLKDVSGVELVGNEAPSSTWLADDSSGQLETSITTADAGKEIFLSHLDEMQASELLRQNLLITEQPALNLLSDEKIDGQVAKDGVGILSVQVPIVMDNVGAVLAASEKAVAAVEPTLLVQDSPTSPLQSSEESETLPVASAVGESEAVQKISAPSVGKILRFAIPAIGVWLCGPLLSLIDTSCVGLLSGTIQQAALNPAVAVTDYSALLIAFLYTATTNLLAAARESDRAVAGSPRAARTLIGVLQLSTFVGTGLGLVLFVFARTLLQAIIGNDGISPVVFDAAMKYVRIRALGMPAAAVIGSAQAACLGMQDIRSPLYVLFAAAVVNFSGDMLFVGSSHPWIGGAAGAAWATVFSQYAAVAFFIHWLCHKPKRADKLTVVNLSNAILELTDNPSRSGSAGAARRRRFRDAIRSLNWSNSPSKEEKVTKVVNARGGGLMSSLLRPKSVAAGKVTSNNPPKEESFSARGFLAGRFRGLDLIKRPPKQTLDEFKEYVIPVTTTQVGRVSGYVAMSHVVSSSLGTVSMAAQQVIVSLFYCLCPIADSLSLTAQSFVPAISEKKASKDRTQALKQTIINFLKASSVFGAVMATAVSCIPLLSGFFTTDPVVVSLVNKVAPILVGWFAVHGVVCATEGLLMAQKDLSFLGRMYAGFFAVLPLLMLRIKSAALAGVKGVDLTSVWKLFLGYQLFRFVVWSGRVGLLQRRTERATKNTGETELLDTIMQGSVVAPMSAASTSA